MLHIDPEANPLKMHAKKNLPKVMQ